MEVGEQEDGWVNRKMEIDSDAAMSPSIYSVYHT